MRSAENAPKEKGLKPLHLFGQQKLTDYKPA